MTSTIGPFPAGTGVGFFLHANGAGVDYLSSKCRSNTALVNCLIQNGGRNYDCYRNYVCSIDAAQGSVTPGSTTYNFSWFRLFEGIINYQNRLYTWSSIDSVNLYSANSNRRHAALIETSYGIILGFEDLFDLGDQNYNDGFIYLSFPFSQKSHPLNKNSNVFIICEVNIDFFTLPFASFFPFLFLLIKWSGDYYGSFPKLCEPSCNELNGNCDYSTGTCVCNSTSGVTQSSSCDCTIFFLKKKCEIK